MKRFGPTIRFVMNGGGWSMRRDFAIQFALGVINQKNCEFNLDSYPFAEPLKYRGEMHYTHACHGSRCYHPLDWKREDWISFLNDMKALGGKPKLFSIKGGSNGKERIKT